MNSFNRDINPNPDNKYFPPEFNFMYKQYLVYQMIAGVFFLVFLLSYLFYNGQTAGSSDFFTYSWAVVWGLMFVYSTTSNNLRIISFFKVKTQDVKKDKAILVSCYSLFWLPLLNIPIWFLLYYSKKKSIQKGLITVDKPVRFDRVNLIDMICGRSSKGFSISILLHSFIFITLVGGFLALGILVSMKIIFVGMLNSYDNMLIYLYAILFHLLTIYILYNKSNYLNRPSSNQQVDQKVRKVAKATIAIPFVNLISYTVLAFIKLKHDNYSKLG
ncbi:hypothetical protein SHELI_v1c02660 [Spiroplasma helicoides]|uniref:Uncharacterized protein n=1 Tax=Spiroplasma helicoides TaxID=216938 RepID=A0A1B3SJW6_9MOLU|nr:hypothetical protein [Spiroplasma helicoides]AOG60221.1 hypothetical protein SHELI_v1c02660 [Spiroplasma helicoides]